ncbi:hypothetical protein A1O7_06163 [Cladophialophora yegresii CBS 114405]|uniref:Uncharacterized protein n=1 Tax=Cladophialophora yegresii CBS 114405 TaxID=1182544 RepID=W9VT35_9EURO|nr:uncharacterized protein A1O7_06163 [Cladophialophora yegresii CBS 114405]EXJ58733.1 hypothetical protein A1O7_06163 [Cladophialophora yegresii CBS 114405]
MVPAALPPSLAAKLSANLRYLEMPLMAVASLRWDGVLRGFSGLRELCIRPFAIQVPGPADLPDEWDVRGPLPPSLRAPLQALRFSFGLPHSWPGDVSWRRLLLPVSNELLHFGLAVRKLKSRRLARHIPVPNLLPITHPDYACRTAEYKRSYWLAIYILEWMMDLRRHVFLSVQGDEPETHWVYAHVANGHIDFLRIFYSTLLVMWQEGDPNGLPALRTTLLERQTMGVGPLKIKLAIQLFIQRPEEDKVHLCEIEWDLLKEWYWDVPVSQPYVPEPRDQAAFDQLLGRAVDIEWV